MSEQEWKDYQALIFDIKKRREAIKMARDPSAYLEKLLVEKIAKEIDKHIINNLKNLQ
jgi:hypothetical protein